ncbi:MAG TPA: histone deacetylase [Myxococcota bacterium]|nr:histone deacetylase [Myxococcota bacterium]HRY93527.1 histone deacetylase [Myxococcota bacterium]HSA20548.1 histone deacetylase [Myxococcota bacterium]
MNRTAVVTDPVFAMHDPGPYHPESPARARAIQCRLEADDLRTRLARLAPRAASQAEICRVHTPGYYRRVAATAGHTASLDPDTQTSVDSFRAAELAAGGLLALTEAVVRGEVRNGFALVRPPGHHAERDRAMGFCLFNNVAVAAEHALAALGLARVLILDWDLHHGNGSMHSFWERADVLYASTHQYPYYPGTGAVDEVGAGPGRGFSVNVPLPCGMGDAEYTAIFREIFAPVVAAYRPELILVSAGFDIFDGDPLGGMRVSPQGFAWLTSQVMEMAAVCQGRVVLTLEGGYHVEGQAESVAACLQALLGEPPGPPPPRAGVGQAGPILAAVKRVQGQFWKLG